VFAAQNPQAQGEVAVKGLPEVSWIDLSRSMSFLAKMIWFLSVSHLSFGWSFSHSANRSTQPRRNCPVYPPLWMEWCSMGI
jgi:hypothetical protein